MRPVETRIDLADVLTLRTPLAGVDAIEGLADDGRHGKSTLLGSPLDALKGGGVDVEPNSRPLGNAGSLGHDSPPSENRGSTRVMLLGDYTFLEELSPEVFGFP